MRLPLAVPILSRDGTLNKGSKLVNVYTEFKGQRAQVYSRPGISTAADSFVGYGNGIFSPVGLSSATQTDDSNTVYTFVNNEFIRTYEQGDVPASGIYGGPASSTASAFIPFYFAGHYYVATSTLTHVFRTKELSSTYQWELHSSTSTVGNKYGIVTNYNGTIFLAGRNNASDADTIAYTTDASTWTEFTLPAIQSMAFITAFLQTASGIYAYQGTQSNIEYFSANPTVSSSWTSTSTVASASSNFIVRGAGKIIGGNYYLIGNHFTQASSLVYSASDGASWSNVSTIPTTAALPMFSGKAGIWRDRFWVIRTNGDMSMSPDAQSWSAITGTSKSTAAVTAYYDDNANLFWLHPSSPLTTASTFWLSSVTATYQQQSISTIINPSNVPIDMIYG